MVKVTGRRGRRHEQLPDDLEETILEAERESNRSHSGENSLWTTLWARGKPEYGMNFPTNHQNFTPKAGGGCPATAPTTKEDIRKLFCRPDDIKYFTRFTFQPELVIEFGC